MTLEEISSISQTIAAVAVVASLIFVGLQLRQSQKMERAAAQRDLLLRVAEWTRMVNREGEGAYDKFVVALRDYESAAALTQMQLDKFLSEFVFITESALNMHRDGFFSDGTWRGIEGAALALLRTPGGQQWWNYARHFVGAEIAEHLNRRLSKIDPATPHFLNFTPASLKRLKELDAYRDANKPEAPIP